ncbi:MAG: TonB-dependent receptor plug domain-containing protein [Fidelibacterota bacterium]
MRASLIWIFLAFCALAHAQAGRDIVLEGEVQDVNTHRQIPGVNIFIKDTQTGTTSDFAGRFSLEIPETVPETVVVFQHIGYEAQEIRVEKLISRRIIYLRPRVIPMEELQVEAPGRVPEIERDLPQTISVIGAEDFEIRGFIDAADLLRKDHSIQVEEQLSGRKTVAIRAGNPEDVVILYNGTKLNSTYNHLFDLSLISLEDVDRLEIIKGSNTTLYGSEAFSGIINIVPRVQQSYNARFQQRIGTYDSGDWGLNLYYGTGGFHGSYNYKQGASRRKFFEGEFLENTSENHSANLILQSGEKGSSDRRDRTLSASFLRSSQTYTDHRDGESLTDFNQVALLRYGGDLAGIRKLDLSLSHHAWDESQSLFSRYGTVVRDFQDRSIHLSAQKRFEWDRAEWLLKVDSEEAGLVFQDRRTLTEEQSVGLEQATFFRQRQGVASIVKFHSPSLSNEIQVTDFDLSIRRDFVMDSQEDAVVRGEGRASSFVLFDRKGWSRTTFKLSTHFTGGVEHRRFDIYMNYGTNVRFPTIFQQISSPEALQLDVTRSNLNPEEITAVELGLSVRTQTPGHPAIDAYELSLNLFRNDYRNKLRVFYPVGIPVALYDNVETAGLTGLETRSEITMFQKKLTLELALSLYDVSEKAAFPFKSETKISSGVTFDHAGYSLQLTVFKEGEQVGWIYQETGNLAEVSLPSQTNLDLHLRKAIQWGRMRLLVNISGRNLLNRDVDLEGLALRDRRVYLTVGAQV